MNNDRQRKVIAQIVLPIDIVFSNITTVNKPNIDDTANNQKWKKLFLNYESFIKIL
jgi:hypothetical protein